MQPGEFAAYHAPALARNEVRHNLILGILARLGTDAASGSLYWTLGGSVACAVKTDRQSIVLGELDATQCHELAAATVALDCPGVVGPDLTAEWFVERARTLGLDFRDPVRQRIYSLSAPPRYPGASGVARPAAAEDAPLVADWLTAFLREAVPRDPVPSRRELEGTAGDGRFLLWVDQGRPVSMAGIARRLPGTAAISGVYTPPALRGRGYAGSATAATVERIFAEGRRTASLYTDLSNPASNRCYARIGFEPVCGSLHYYRRRDGEA
jgi:predicted GNAT family acetyltransferase